MAPIQHKPLTELDRAVERLLSPRVEQFTIAREGLLLKLDSLDNGNSRPDMHPSAVGLITLPSHAWSAASQRSADQDTCLAHTLARLAGSARPERMELQKRPDILIENRPSRISARRIDAPARPPRWQHPTVPASETKPPSSAVIRADLETLSAQLQAEADRVFAQVARAEQDGDR